MTSGYYHTKASVEEYVELAKDVSGAKLIEKLSQFLSDHSSLLELGTGPGTDWKLLNERYNVVGSDFSKAFLTHLESEVPAGTFLELNAATLDTSLSFDGIYSNKVLHHLTNDELEQSIDRQHHILNQNGVICHSFWKGEGSEIFKGLFVNYHTEDELRTLFSSLFEIELIEPYEEFEEDDSLLFVARKRD